MERRSFLLGMLAMPAIIRPGILMPVRSIIEPPAMFHITGATTIYRSDFGNLTYRAYADFEDLSDVIYKIAPIVDRHTVHGHHQA